MSFPHVPVSKPLLERFWAKVQVARFPNGCPDYDPCWDWLAGCSRSGRREVAYPSLWAGGHDGPALRAHRLSLMLWTVPRLAGEADGAWLARAIAIYRGVEAAHTCDRAICVNPTHLCWESHSENIANAVFRRSLGEPPQILP